MNILEIINEEFSGFLNEVQPRNVHAYPYTKVSDTKYRIRIDDDEKNIHTNYEVTFSPTGNADEKVVGLSFKEEQGEYNINDFGIQFRILATVTKIVNDMVRESNPDIITFSPIKQGRKINPKTGKVKNVNPNQRLLLYMNYVKEGAGEDFDAFIIGDADRVQVERKNPSYPIENGYVDPETIQDVVTQLSKYGGHYQSGDVGPNDPNFIKFDADYGRMLMSKGGQRVKSTGSIRRFVDWMMDYPELIYVPGRSDPDRDAYRQSSQQAQPSDEPVDRPVRRVGATPDRPRGQAMIGSFDYFLQNNVYGIDRYAALNDYYEGFKTINDFRDLRSRAQDMISSGLQPREHARLQEVIDTIDMLEREYHVYAREHGSQLDETLNEIEASLKELMK